MTPLADMTATGKPGSSIIIAYSVGPDTRSATILSNLGQTFHQGPPDGSGNPTIVTDTLSGSTMTATTVGPYGSGFAAFNPSITYTGYAGGDFTNNSSYNMYSKVKGNDNSGLFGGGGEVTSFTNTYTDQTDPQERIHLHLIDSGDQSSAVSDYYVNFHQPIEGWTKLGSTTYPNDSPPAADWTFVCDINNDSAASPTSGASYSESIATTYSATVGGSSNLSYGDIIGINQNESVTLGNTVTGTAGGSATFPGAPWSDIKYFVSPSYTMDYGTFLAYGSDGFDGQQSWTCISSISNVLSVGSITVTNYAH